MHVLRSVDNGNLIRDVLNVQRVIVIVVRRCRAHLATWSAGINGRPSHWLGSTVPPGVAPNAATVTAANSSRPPEPNDRSNIRYARCEIKALSNISHHCEQFREPINITSQPLSANPISSSKKRGVRPFTRATCARASTVRRYSPSHANVRTGMS